MLLVQGGTVWLLDEPSAGLAPDVVRRIMDLIQSMSESLHITVVMAEQNIPQVLRIAQRLCFMKDKTLNEIRTPIDILDDRLFAGIFPKGD
jgi:ABC-type branched-subunit amino acid transport system ATPase component